MYADGLSCYPLKAEWKGSLSGGRVNEGVVYLLMAEWKGSLEGKRVNVTENETRVEERGGLTALYSLNHFDISGEPIE